MKRTFKNYLFAIILLMFSSNAINAQHYSTIWSGFPFNPMTIIVQNATIDGVGMEVGDEIAVFDIGDGGVLICVGTTVLTSAVTPGTPCIVTAGQDEPGGSIDGYTAGNTIVYKFWDNSESVEITAVVPTYMAGFDSEYASLGTAIATSLVGSSSLETTAQSITTCQGSVIVPIDVSNFNDVGELSLVLDYETTNLTYTGYQNANPVLTGLSISENAGEITFWLNITPTISIGTGTFVELLFNANTVTAQTTANLTWDAASYYKDGTGASIVSTFIDGVVTIDPIPVDAGTITGTTPVCQGTNSVSYSTGAIVNATSLVWELLPTTAGTINGSSTNITIDYSTTFSGAATLTVYGSNTCGNGTLSSLPITVIAHPTVDAGNDVSICEDATQTLSGAATDQQSILWTTSGDGTFDDATLLDATYTPGNNDISTGTATLTITAYAVSPCAPDVTDDMVITIQPLPTAGAGNDVTICEDATHTLAGNASNEQSILWASSGDGTFDDATLLAATYTPGTSDKASGSAVLTITAYAITPCGTDATDDMTITIQDLPTAVAGSDATICEDVTYTLSGTASDQQSVLWTTNGDGTFDDATLLGATYTPGVNDISNTSVVLTLTSYAITPCGTDATDDMTLSIQYQPTTGAGTDATICENNTHTLAGTSANQQSILWTTSGDGTFDDATLLAATYTPGVSDISTGSATLTITAYAIAPCGTDATEDMVLSITLLPLTDAGADESICVTNPVYTLSGTASNQTSILWTSGGDGTFDDATLLTATYTAGTNDLIAGSVTLTITAYPDAPCATNAVDDMLLTYAPLPVANAGTDDEICLNTPSYLVSGASATDYTDVLWTTSGDGTFVDATLLNPTYTPGTNDRANGTVDLTITASSVALCVDDDTMTLTFAVLPTSDAGADAEICEDNTYQLSGTATDYSSLGWTTDGDGSFDDITSLTAIYTPGAVDITNGTVNLTLTAFASFPCVDDADDIMVLSIAWLPIANAGADDEICLNTASYYLANATAENQSSVLWTTSGDGTFDDATLVNPTYTPGANDIANFNVTLTITAYATSPCAIDDVDDMLLTFSLLPTADAGSDDNVCETDSFTLSGSYTNGSSSLWTTSGDGTFDDATLPTATYTLGTNDIIAGTVDLTITAYAQFPCTDDAVDVMTLTIMLLPIADAGIDDGICANVTFFTTDGTTSGDVSSTLWTTSGDGTFDDATLLVTNYNPGPNDITNEGVDLTLTANPTAPCSSSVSDDMFLLIQPLPTSNAGDDDEICENESYMLNGSATNFDHVYWSTAGDGTFDDAFLLNATYTPGPADIGSGSVNLTMFAYSISPCNGEVGDVMTLFIVGQPDANAGDDAGICENESYTLAGTAENYASIVWTTSGDGSFDDASLLDATYTPGANDLIVGTVNLTLTAIAMAPCASDAIDEMELGITLFPDQPSLPDGPIAVDLDVTLTSEYTTEEVVNATSYLWVLEPPEAGTFDGTGLIGTAHWSADYVDIVAYVSVTAINDCGETISEVLGVSLSPVGINQMAISDNDITIAPNPSTGRFDILIDGVIGDFDLIIVNAAGQFVQKQELLNTLGNTTHSIDISNQPKGAYYLKLINNNGVVVKKILLK